MKKENVKMYNYILDEN